MGRRNYTQVQTLPPEKDELRFLSMVCAYSPGRWERMRKPSSLRRLQVILERVGCKKIRFHDLRYTFATVALENGMDIKTLSAMLGPVSAATSLDTSLHITNDMQRGAAEKSGGFMETATAKPEPEPPDPLEASRCKVISFERVG